MSYKIPANEIVGRNSDSDIELKAWVAAVSCIPQMESCFTFTFHFVDNGLDGFTHLAASLSTCAQLTLVQVALQPVIRTTQMHPVHILHISYSGKQHNAFYTFCSIGGISWWILSLTPTCTKRITSWCKCSVLVQGKVSPRARAGCESVWRVGVRWWPASAGGCTVEDTSGRTPGQDTGHR